MIFRPLLASAAPPESWSSLRYPLLASPKLDGIRVLIIDGKPMTRSLKLVPNRYIQEQLSRPEFEGLDGEIIIGKPTATDVFNVTSSGVMSRDGRPDFTYFVFDFHNSDKLYEERLDNAISLAGRTGLPLGGVFHTVISSAEHLPTYEEAMLKAGWEGIMLRSTDGRYKNGRSTLKEQILLKVKRTADAEATVIGFEELMHNANDATVDNLGHTERSSHKANLVGLGTLGALRVQCSLFEKPFNIGTGYDAATRARFWNFRPFMLGKIVKFKYQEVGVKDVPRFPVFLGIRDPLDL